MRITLLTIKKPNAWNLQMWVWWHHSRLSTTVLILLIFLILQMIRDSPGRGSDGTYVHFARTHTVHLKALKVFDFISKQLIGHFAWMKDFPIKRVCVILLQSSTEGVNPSWISAAVCCCHIDVGTLRKCITLWCLFQVCFSARPIKRVLLFCACIKSWSSRTCAAWCTGMDSPEFQDKMFHISLLLL